MHRVINFDAYIIYFALKLAHLLFSAVVQYVVNQYVGKGDHQKAMNGAKFLAT